MRSIKVEIVCWGLLDHEHFLQSREKPVSLLKKISNGEQMAVIKEKLRMLVFVSNVIKVVVKVEVRKKVNVNVVTLLEGENILYSKKGIIWDGNVLQVLLVNLLEILLCIKEAHLLKTSKNYCLVVIIKENVINLIKEILVY